MRNVFCFTLISLFLFGNFAYSQDLSVNNDSGVKVDSGVKSESNVVVKTDNDSKKSWWKVLIFETVFEIIVPILITIISSLLILLLRKIGLKTEIETLEKVAENAANYAEQRSREWFYENNQKMDSTLKENYAWKLVSSINKKYYLDNKIRIKLRSMIIGKISEAEKKSFEVNKLKENK